MNASATRAAGCILGCVAALLTVGTPASAQDLLLVHANVVDVTDGSIARDASVLVREGRIVSVGFGDVQAPDGVQVVDLTGRYLAPGLMDAHVHIASVSQARRALGYGVTTLRSMGVSNYADVGLRELHAQGYADIPEMRAAGYHVRPGLAAEFFLDHPDLGAYAGQAIRGADALRAVTRANVSRGANVIKVLATERAGLPDTDPRKQVYSQEELKAVVDAAKAGGLAVAAHAHGDAGARDAVLAGVASIEHGTYLSRETLALMEERGTFLVPTIAIVRDLTLAGGDYDNATLNIRGRHMLPRVQAMARTAHELGVRIGAATDTGYGPESTTILAHELLELVAIGMTPLEALQAATINNAELLGVSDHTGRIAEGLDADLIVLEHNPLEDIGTVQDVLMVVNDGKIVIRRGDWPDTRPIS